jgi:hypothetical protein
MHSFREMAEMMERERSLDEDWRKWALAGAMGAAVAAPFVGNAPESPPPHRVGMDRRISEEMKDHGRYYDSATERRLRRAAEEGDEWAVRELPWPAGHPLHKKGRPFSRNEKPHPKGLFPNSGY